MVEPRGPPLVMMKGPLNSWNAWQILGDQVVEDDGGDHGHRDGEELAPLAGTVNGSGLVQVCGYALQRSQEQHHGRAELPNAQEADDPQGVVGVRQPGGTLEVTEGDRYGSGC